MEIYNHTILDSEIIGVSPLYARTNTSAQVRFSFHVYTKQNNIEIISDPYYEGIEDEKIKLKHQEMQKERGRVIRYLDSQIEKQQL
jgi:hypothetical protein